ncbi:MAG: class IV adenylate cyclase [Candidatus Diapherotrites archaeon]|nr:class IV adenylate cyclase [Candidatus Diapherotrites archaeon]
MKSIEIELKFPLLNKNELIKKLDLIAKRDKESSQKDTYYIPKHRNFMNTKPVSEWLRIRETKHGASVTYKNYHKEKNTESVSADEYETYVTNAGELNKLFNAIDIKSLIVVDKKRITWHYKDTEIAIDTVEELGDFIEAEAKKDFASVEEANKYLHSITKEIGAIVGKQDFEGYPFLLMKKKGLLK